MKEKRMVNSNYGIFVVLLFAVVCTLSDYIIISSFLERNSECNVITVNNCDDISVRSYSDVAGMYVYGDMDTIKLYLYTDGTFYYQTSVRYASGIVGSYVLNGDSLVLYSSFRHGSDIAVRTDFSTVMLNISSDGNIIDNNPLYFSNDYEYENIDSVLLEKQNVFTDGDNDNSYYKDVLSRGVLFNGNTVETFS